MKFSTRTDIDAPIDYVFARVSEYDALERQAMRRGVTVQRRADATQPSWDLKVPFRGKLRDMRADVIETDPPHSLKAVALSGGLNMEIGLTLVALSPRRTRLLLGYEVRPQTLSARILVQSVKFAKNTLQKRFEKRVETMSERLSTDYAKTVA